MSYSPNLAERQLFVTTAVLANGATYDSTVLAYDGYTQVQTEITASHDGSLQIDFFSDSAGTDIIRTLTIPYIAASGYQLFGSVCFGSYVRYQFTNNSGSLQTDFYLTTKVTTTALNPQMLRVDGFVSEAMLSTLTRAVNVGANPDGTYQNIQINGLGFETSALLTSTSTYDSGVLSLVGYTQVQTQVLSSHIGTIVIDFCRDSAGADILRTLTIPYTDLDVLQTFSAPAFTPYVRYRFTNDALVTQTDFYFDTKFLTTSLSGQLLGLDSFISPLMLANLGRNLLVGQDGDGTFSNVSVVETSNDDGTYHSLQVVNGARPSQLYGRTAVSIVVDEVTISTLMHTVTTDKTFYVTDIVLTIDNSGSTAGTVKLHDGTTDAGDVISCFMVADPPGSASTNTVITHTYTEPLAFDTAVFLNEAVGTLTICGTINGYEE